MRLRTDRSSIWFQSTPPSEERSDMAALLSLQGMVGFNPRPPPKRGATRAAR